MFFLLCPRLHVCAPVCTSEIFRASGGLFPTAVQRLLLKCLLRRIDLSAFASRSPLSPLQPGRDSADCEGIPSTVSGDGEEAQGRAPREVDECPCEPFDSLSVSGDDSSRGEGGEPGVRCSCFRGDHGESLATVREATEKEEYIAARSFVSLFLLTLKKAVAAGASPADSDTAPSARMEQSSLARFAQRIEQEFSVEQLTNLLLKLSRNMLSILSGEARESGVGAARRDASTHVDGASAEGDSYAASPNSQTDPRAFFLDSCNSPQSGSCPCCFTDSVCAQGLYPFPINCMNHSCAYNARAVFGGRSNLPLAIRFVATRDIRENEEICISYVPRVAFSRSTERRKHLLKGYGFLCCCHLCCGCLPASRDAPRPNAAASRPPGKLADASHCGGEPRENGQAKNASRLERRDTSEDATGFSEGGPKPTSGGETQRERGESAARRFSLSRAFDLQLANVLFCSSDACRALCFTPKADALLALEDERRLRWRGLGGTAQREKRSFQRADASDSMQSVSDMDREHKESWAKQIRLRLPVRCYQGDPGGRRLGNVVDLSRQMEPTRAVCCVCDGELTRSEYDAVRQSLRRLPRLVEQLEFADASSRDTQSRLQRFLSEYMVAVPHLHPGNLLLSTLRARLLSRFLGEPAVYVPWVLLMQEHQVEAAAAVHGEASPEVAHELQAAGRLLLFVGEGNEAEASKAWQTWQEGEKPDAGEAPDAEKRTDLHSEVLTAREKVLLQSYECLRRACGVYFALFGGSDMRTRDAEQVLSHCSRALNDLRDT
ncbi:putative histone lysine methyltransferase, SET [Toxoplasma gondii TgCatPRC2]|uniref:Putative histone lysine methyltransferase, SET n=1 Tax=Toxoplasma gondii TgCatPRC2 TaxID=1130821 RepID=A0A151H0M7_TOXGO|nr:putative histone lysine methyltransferase, SET [Toxoplasma gondii TgCatPRC2]